MLSRDSPEQLALDYQAPSDERYDALQELYSKYLPSNDDLEFANQLIYLAKSETLTPGTPRSAQYDRVSTISRSGYIEKPGSLSFEDLRSISDLTPLISSIVTTRCRQVGRYSQLQSESSAPGFKILHRDVNHQITPDEESEIRLISDFVTNCGWESRPTLRKRLGRLDFNSALRLMVADSLILDACPIELIRVDDGIDGFRPIDGSTIRLCGPSGYQNNPSIVAVQMVFGKVELLYTDSDIVYEVRNPQPDIRYAGYGRSEIELMMKVITGYLNAFTFNLSGFDENSVPRGVWDIVGDYTPESLKAFDRRIKDGLSGAKNAWKTISMIAKSPESRINFNKIDSGFSDIYFKEWFTFLTAIGCSIYGISPEEIGFGAYSDNGGLVNNSFADKISTSRDKGLIPLLSFFEGIMSDYIVSEVSDKYTFKFTGTTPEDTVYKNSIGEKIKTINELRAEQGLPSLGDRGNRLLSEGAISNEPVRSI